MPENKTIIFTRGAGPDKSVFRRDMQKAVTKTKSKKVLETEIAKLQCETHLLKRLLRTVIKTYNSEYDNLQIEATISKLKSSIPKLNFKNMPISSKESSDIIEVNAHQSKVLKNEFQLDPKEFEQELKKLSGQAVKCHDSTNPSNTSQNSKTGESKENTRKRQAPEILKIAPKRSNVQIINLPSERSSSPTASDSSGYTSNSNAQEMSVVQNLTPIVYPCIEPIQMLPSVDTFSQPIITYDRPIESQVSIIEQALVDSDESDPFLYHDFSLDDVLMTIGE